MSLSIDFNNPKGTGPKKPAPASSSPKSIKVTPLFDKKPFSAKTESNLYYNTAVKTDTCRLAQKYLGVQEVTRSQFLKLSSADRQYTQFELVGKDPYYLGAEWCALSMDTILKKCNIHIVDPSIDFVEKLSDGTIKGKGIYSTVSEFVDWGRKNNTYHEISWRTPHEPKFQITEQLKSMKEGDFIVWKHNRSHIGLIESVDLKNGTVTTLEGNANENRKNSRDGFIRKIYTINDLVRTGYSGYIDNSKLYTKK